MLQWTLESAAEAGAAAASVAAAVAIPGVATDVVAAAAGDGIVLVSLLRLQLRLLFKKGNISDFCFVELFICHSLFKQHAHISSGLSRLKGHS